MATFEDEIKELSLNELMRLSQKLEKELKNANDKEKEEITEKLNIVEASTRKRQYMSSNEYNVFSLKYIMEKPASAVVWRINVNKDNMVKNYIPVVVKSRGNGSYKEINIIVGLYKSEVLGIRTGKGYDLYFPLGKSLFLIGNTKDEKVNKVLSDYISFKSGSQEEMVKLASEKQIPSASSLSFSESYKKAKEFVWILVDNVRSNRSIKMGTVINNGAKILATVKRSLNDSMFKQALMSYLYDAVSEKSDHTAKKNLFKSIDNYVSSLNPKLQI